MFLSQRSRRKTLGDVSRRACSECKSAIFNALSGRHKYWAQHEVNRPRGSGSMDKAPDSQWTNASSNPRGAHFWYYRRICIWRLARRAVPSASPTHPVSGAHSAARPREGCCSIPYGYHCTRSSLRQICEYISWLRLELPQSLHQRYKVFIDVSISHILHLKNFIHFWIFFTTIRLLLEILHYAFTGIIRVPGLLESTLWCPSGLTKILD